jgi:hypothetical protein
MSFTVSQATRRSKMKTMLTILTCTLVLALTAGASAEVIWTGDGSPADVGYSVAGSGAFTLDSPEGFMYQDSGGSSLSYWYQALAGTELVRANGWIVEARLESISSSGSLGVYFAPCDDNGGVRVDVKPTEVLVFGQDGWSSSVSIDAEEYHTIRAVMVPGGTNVDIYVDNLTTPALSVLPHTGLANAAVEFGDGSSGAAGEASWDYFDVRAIPEPTSLVLLVAVSLSLVLWRRTGR